jgi:formate dehydrogenase subunit delta
MSEAEHGGGEQLVKMANDIGNFFRAEPAREDAIAGIANHIDKYWTKRMRQKIAAHGDAGLDELPLAALRRLTARSNGAPPGTATSATPPEPPGGDAG